MSEFEIRKVATNSADSEPSFYLCSFGNVLLTFDRVNFQSVMCEYAASRSFGSHWVGAMLRLLNKKYPVRSHCVSSLSYSQILSNYSDALLVDYARSIGFKVIKKIPAPDSEIVERLRLHGYDVEDLKDSCLADSFRAANVG